MISIIIPFYNVELYIKDCLKSLEAQTYRGFEIIAVNDGSTDDSANIVRQFAEKSSMNIRLIEQENAGVSSARNAGIKNAKGDYICFIDSDDMVRPNYLEVMVNIVKQEKCDIAICRHESFADGTEPKPYVDKYKKKNRNVGVMTPVTFLELFLYRQVPVGIWCLLLKREIVSENRLQFAEGYRYSEDIEFIYRTIAYAQRVYCTDRPLYLYRMREGSAMSKVDDSRLDGLELMKGLEDFFEVTLPEFAPLFKKYGVARWLWATLWQLAITSDSLDEFLVNCRKYDAHRYIPRLSVFPDPKVAVTSVIFSISPRFYYTLVRLSRLERNYRKLS